VPLQVPRLAKMAHTSKALDRKEKEMKSMSAIYDKFPALPINVRQ